MYIEGPAPLEDVGCTRRNGCLTSNDRVHRLTLEPIARQVGRGSMLGIVREPGFPVSASACAACGRRRSRCARSPTQRTDP
jgi:hypothetical protein